MKRTKKVNRGIKDNSKGKSKNKGKSVGINKEGGHQHDRENKIDIRRSLMGGLDDGAKDTKERHNNLQRRLDEANKGRISIIPDDREGTHRERGTQTNTRSKIKSRSRKEKQYTQKQKEIVKEEYEKDYVWIRRELEGYAPLYKLDIWNKIKTSLRLIDEKSGKTAMKEAERIRIENMKAIKIESEIKRKITEYTKDILEAGVQKMEIEITIAPDHMASLERVLSQDYFGMFRLKLIEINPNLKRYGINPPILLEVERR